MPCVRAPTRRRARRAAGETGAGALPQGVSRRGTSCRRRRGHRLGLGGQEEGAAFFFCRRVYGEGRRFRASTREEREGLRVCRASMCQRGAPAADLDAAAGLAELLRADEEDLLGREEGEPPGERRREVADVERALDAHLVRAEAVLPGAAPVLRACPLASSPDAQPRRGSPSPRRAPGRKRCAGARSALTLCRRTQVFAGEGNAIKRMSVREHDHALTATALVLAFAEFAT